MDITSQKKEKALCRAMAMIVDADILLDDALNIYKEEDLLTPKGKALLHDLGDLSENLQEINNNFSDTIDEAARMSGCDVTDIGYED